MGNASVTPQASLDGLLTSDSPLLSLREWVPVATFSPFPEACGGSVLSRLIATRQS